jgi:hypothetical protein
LPFEVTNLSLIGRVSCSDNIVKYNASQQNTKDKTAVELALEKAQQKDTANYSLCKNFENDTDNASHSVSEPFEEQIGSF